MTDDKRDDLLLQMAKDVSEIKVKLDADFRALHGNGHPGLIDDVKCIDKRLVQIEERMASKKDAKNYRLVIWGLLINIIATVIAFLTRGV